MGPDDRGRPPDFSELGPSADVLQIQEAARKAAGPLAESAAFRRMTSTISFSTPEEVKRQYLEKWETIVPAFPDLSAISTQDPNFSFNLVRALEIEGLPSSTSSEFVRKAKEKAGLGGINDRTSFSRDKKVAMTFDGGFTSTHLHAPPMAPCR